MAVLAKAAAYLTLPPRLVGLADPPTQVRTDGTEQVERRELLTGAVAVVATPALSALAGQHQQAESGHAATLRVATTAYRRLDGTTPSRQLAEVVLPHLGLIQNITRDTKQAEARARLAAVGSEAASLAGWLSWDMGDAGSARTWYGSAIRAARQSGNALLAAYQTGSLAQMEAETGNAAQALTLVNSARRQLGAQVIAIADAWLSTVEALAHAAAGDERSSDRALVRSRTEALRVPSEEPPPWPWVFTFDERKVVACRLACGARLNRPDWIFGGGDEATLVASAAHEKQRALLQLDLAFGHLASGRLEIGYLLATRAVESGLRYKSGRIVERARVFRRSYSSRTPPKVVRAFDDRLHDAYL
jgi:hypothetical protein